jgi:hypothetical protein
MRLVAQLNQICCVCIRVASTNRRLHKLPRKWLDQLELRVCLWRVMEFGAQPGLKLHMWFNHQGSNLNGRGYTGLVVSSAGRVIASRLPFKKLPFKVVKGCSCNVVYSYSE